MSRTIGVYGIVNFFFVMCRHCLCFDNFDITAITIVSNLGLETIKFPYSFIQNVKK